MIAKRSRDTSDMEPQQIHQLISVGRKQGTDSNEFQKRLARIVGRYEDERAQAFAERLAENILQCDDVLQRGYDPEADACVKASRQKLAQICLGKLTLDEIIGHNKVQDPVGIDGPCEPCRG